jgi:hypothetical protein
VCGRAARKLSSSYKGGIMTALELIAIATVVFTARVASDKTARQLTFGLFWLQMIILCWNIFDRFNYRIGV